VIIFSSCVLLLDQANSLCTTVYDSVRTKLRPTVALKFDKRRAAIQAAINQTTNDQMVLISRWMLLMLATLYQLPSILSACFIPLNNSGVIENFNIFERYMNVYDTEILEKMN
jgi:hypothetical protein